MKKYKCSTCKKYLPENSFYKNKAQTRGFASQCKECKKEYGKKLRCTDNGRKKQLEYSETRRNSKKGRFLQYIWGAKDRNIVFKLSFEEFCKFWNKDCYYCGDKIIGIGIDRIDNDCEYIFDKVVSCCSTCNIMKMKLNSNDFIKKCTKIGKKHS